MPVSDGDLAGTRTLAKPSLILVSRLRRYDYHRIIALRSARYPGSWYKIRARFPNTFRVFGIPIHQNTSLLYLSLLGILPDLVKAIRVCYNLVLCQFELVLHLMTEMFVLPVYSGRPMLNLTVVGIMKQTNSNN